MPFLDRAGVKLHYEVKGSGIPVLMLQGVGVIGEGWRPQVQDLCQDYQVAIIDNRGLGQSTPCSSAISILNMADDALAVITELGWKSAHVVGHSMGGVIAQQLAMSEHKRIRSLSLLCSFSRGAEAARLTWPVLKMTVRTRLGSPSSKRRAFLEMLMPAAHLKGKDLELLASQIAELVGRDLATSPPILMKQLQAMRGSNLTRRLRDLADIPTLIVSAKQDPIALPLYGRRLQTAIPGSRYVELEDAAHGVTIEQPQVINPLLREFFAEVDTAITSAVRP